MDETRFAQEFLVRMNAGEFVGRLYQTILNLSSCELQQIACLLADQYRALQESETNRRPGLATREA